MAKVDDGLHWVRQKGSKGGREKNISIDKMYKVLERKFEMKLTARYWQVLSVSAKADHQRHKVKSSEIKATYVTCKRHTRQMR